MDLYILLFYLFVVAKTFYFSSKKESLYLFSPVLVIDITYILYVLVPYLSLYSVLDIGESFHKIVFYSTIVNLCFHFLLRPFNYEKIKIDCAFNISYELYWKKIIKVSLSIILFTGLLTGVTKGLLTGENIEGLRRTSEIGIGFLREIPMLAVLLGLFYILLISSAKEKMKLKYVLLIACLLFVSIGNKSVILKVIVVYISYLTIKHRGFRLYEYLVYYMAIPFSAALLDAFRQNNFNSIGDSINKYLMYGTFIFQVNTVKIVEKIEKTEFLNGKEFYSGFYKIIPRFLWKDKPLSFDYYYKELIGYEFEGGGTPMPLIYRFYTKFGNSFCIYYIIWMCFLFYCYRKFYNTKSSSSILFLMFFFLNYCSPDSLFGYVELYFLLLLLLYFVFKKRML